MHTPYEDRLRHVKAAADLAIIAQLIVVCVVLSVAVGVF